ncbi:MAG: NAD-dependent epimerase/dehydratase family protein [Planctomycetia bacterium]|nr:NAD-dependent epimerase/dehydratase family protein [Planctomycetia bacterium]
MPGRPGRRGSVNAMSPSSIDAYTLLTGATGLLGRALVRDLAAAGRRVAVVVRGSAAAPAADRVDELLDDWWQVAGASVPCPVVLEGDLSIDGLGLSAEQTAWIARHVREVVHSAASLSFQLRPADGEPYTSNVTGTRNVLALCRTAGIRRLHHVSSAYVCGLRRGTILEGELDVGQESGNDYERSKIVSEGEATAAEWIDVCTVHRPSIIVGDLVHGFTNTFHGFYKPLRIVQPFVEAFLTASMEPGSLLDVLGMNGAERKNLVPVDWVSAVMTRIIRDESLHGRTYHLTSDVPTDVGTLCKVFESLVVEMAAARRARRRSPGSDRRRSADSFSTRCTSIAPTGATTPRSMRPTRGGPCPTSRRRRSTRPRCGGCAASRSRTTSAGRRPVECREASRAGRCSSGISARHAGPRRPEPPSASPRSGAAADSGRSPSTAADPCHCTSGFHPTTFPLHGSVRMRSTTCSLAIRRSPRSPQPAGSSASRPERSRARSSRHSPGDQLPRPAKAVATDGVTPVRGRSIGPCGVRSRPTKPEKSVP